MIDEGLFALSPRKETAVDAVVNRFKELILQKKLRPGDLIPSEGVLAESMGVSRGSLREAMKILSVLGVVDIRRGDGTYVSIGNGGAGLDPLLLRLMMSDYDLEQWMEFREMIEFDVARTALRHRNPEGLAAVRQAFAAMEQAAAGGDAAHSAQMDLAFHQALGQATGNALIEQLYAYVLRFFELSIVQTYAQPDNPAMALQYHKDILDALEAGEESRLLQAVKNSIQGWATRRP